MLVAELILSPRTINDFSVLDNMFHNTTKNINYYSFPSTSVNCPSGLSGQAGFILIRKYGTNGTMQIIIISSAIAYMRSNTSSLEGQWNSWIKF